MRVFRNIAFGVILVVVLIVGLVAQAGTYLLGSPPRLRSLSPRTLN